MSKPVNIIRWEDLVRQYGCVVSREVPVQLHHVEGRTAKKKTLGGTVLYGPWYILPLAPRYHDVHSNNDFNVTHHKKRFEIEFGKQRDLWLEMVAKMLEQHQDIPVPEEIIWLIGQL